MSVTKEQSILFDVEETAWFGPGYEITVQHGYPKERRQYVYHQTSLYPNMPTKMCWEPSGLLACLRQESLSSGRMAVSGHVVWLNEAGVIALEKIGWKPGDTLEATVKKVYHEWPCFFPYLVLQL